MALLVKREVLPKFHKPNRAQATSKVANLGGHPYSKLRISVVKMSGCSALAQKGFDTEAKGHLG